MAQQMSIEEMVRMIDDVLGGSFEFTLWQATGETSHRLEVKCLDLGNAEVGQKDVHLSPRETKLIRANMYMNRPYDLGDLPFNAVRIISERSIVFRGYACRELEP